MITRAVLVGVGVAAAVLVVALAAGGPEPEQESPCWDVRHSTVTARHTIRVNRCTSETWVLAQDTDSGDYFWKRVWAAWDFPPSFALPPVPDSD